MTDARSYEDTMQDAIDFIKANPSIFSRVRTNTNPSRGQKSKTASMIVALAEQFPSLGDRSIVKLLPGTTREIVRRIRQNQVEKEIAFDDEQEEREERAIFVAGDLAYVAALKLHHPGRYFEDDPRALRDTSPVRLVQNPMSDSAHYKADQSHTKAKPITLPSSPFKYAA